jgi:hypothetical protein
MANEVLRFDVVMPMLDLTLDPMSFSLHYERSVTAGATIADAQHMATSLAATFNDAGAPLAAGFPAAVSRLSNAALINVTNVTAHLDGTPAGSPFASVHWTVGTTPSTTPIPEGCSIALSYRSDYGSDPEFVRDPVTHKVTGRPRATHRNRIFFPTNEQHLVQDPTSHRAKVGGSWATRISTWLNAVKTLADLAANIYYWRQWSKKTARVLPIVQASWDDRPDYQRRRVDAGNTGATYAISEAGLFVATHEVGPGTQLLEYN